MCFKKGNRDDWLTFCNGIKWYYNICTCALWQNLESATLYMWPSLTNRAYSPSNFDHNFKVSIFITLCVEFKFFITYVRNLWRFYRSLQNCYSLHRIEIHIVKQEHIFSGYKPYFVRPGHIYYIVGCACMNIMYTYYYIVVPISHYYLDNWSDYWCSILVIQL